ncbi:MAG: hypothetical protein WCT10_02680 [Patescibacteria group bacterium]|jgi:hypothetical protein
MSGEQPRELNLEDIINKTEPTSSQDSSKTEPAEKNRDAAQDAQQPAAGEESRLAKTSVFQAETKKLADKYEGVRDEVARLSQELNSGKLDPKQAKFKQDFRENLKQDYFRELVDSVVTSDTKLGTEVVKLGMDYPEIAKDHPYQDMLKELSNNILETTQAKSQFEALIAGSQTGEVAVQKLRERITQNMDGFMKGARSKLENQFGARGERAKKLAANRAKIQPPKVLEFKTKRQLLREQLKGFFDEVQERLGNKPEDQEKEKPARDKAA